MQFITNGPDIPDALLQAHEEGRVVFFCGAGISYPAGLKNFEWLSVLWRLWKAGSLGFGSTSRGSVTVGAAVAQGWVHCSRFLLVHFS